MNHATCLISAAVLCTVFSNVSIAEPTSGKFAPLMLEEIVVSGEKTGRTQLETLNSATVITAEELDFRGIADLKQAVRRTAGVTEVGNNQGFAIRGVPLFGTSGAGSRFSTTINLVVDGVSQDRFSQRINPFDAWDVRQIEIFKGGQSLNLGRSSIAGAVVIDTFDPAFEDAYALEGRLGSDDGRGMLGMANIRLGDSAAFRMAAGATRDDGWVYNPTLNDNADASENEFVRLKLLWQASERFEALTMLNYDSADTGDDFVDPDDPFSREIFSNEPAIEDNERQAVAQRLNWQVGDAWSTTALGTFQTSNYQRSDDSDRSAEVTGTLFREEDTDEITLELRFNYQQEGRRGFLGVFAADKSVEEEFGSAGFDISPVLGRPPGSLILDFESDVSSEIRNYAVFGELELFFNERWSTRLAARYDIQEETLSQSQLSSLEFITPPGSDVDDTSFDEFLPFASITYHLGDDSNLSVFYKESYRSGGVEIDLANGRTNTFDPEYTQSYEVAYRGVFSKLTILGNLYFTEWKDQQIQFNETGLVGLETTQNAGSSSQYGLEAALQWQVVENIILYSSVSLATTRFDEFDQDPGDDTDFSGNEFPFAPEHAAGLGVTWALSDTLTLDFNANYQDSTFVDAANEVENDDYLLLNATLSWESGNWYVGVSGSNLADDEYITRNNAPGFAVQVGDPLLWSAKIGYRFSDD